MFVFRRQSLHRSAILSFSTLIATVSICSLTAAQAPSSRPMNAVTSAAAEPALRLQWTRLFKNRQWAELDSLAQTMRSQRLRFQGGGWQLHVLYCILSGGCEKAPTDASWQERIAALQDWSRQAPSSPTPRIAMANAYQYFAWKARGRGNSGSVTSEGWKVFDERVQKARDILEQSSEIGHSDPEWYNAMLRVAIDQGWSGHRVQALTDEALSTHPGYFYVIREVAEYLLPKWYGAPGDTERFVEAAADRIGGAQGDATYFFYAEIQLVNESLCLDCLPLGISWTRLRRGYAAIERLYGINNYELNALAYLALRAGDYPTARRTFKAIGDKWDSDVWPTRSYFDAARNLSYHPPIPPRLPNQTIRPNEVGAP